jgi:serine/threonine-protein kinase
VVVDEAPPRRNPWGWLLAALFAAAAIVFLVLWLRERDRGADTTPAPNLIGLRAVQAQRDALARGFRLTTVERTSTNPAGTVLDQAPEPGAALEKHARMMAVVSSGKASVTVPRLVGLKRSAAEQVLQPLGLVLQTRFVQSDQPGGIVLSQTPEEGDRVGKGTMVAVTISKGPSLVAVPAVLGLTVDRATAALTDAGLLPQVIQVSSSEAANTVLAQDPQRGQKVKRGSTVRINVSTGPTATATEPTTVTVVSTRRVTTIVTTATTP